MHIQTFFERIEARKGSEYKRGLLGDDAEAAERCEILDIYLADDAFDHYYARALGPLVSRARTKNYILCCLHSFGVHQLTMRRFPPEGGQMFAQVGALDGHEFAFGLIDNVQVRGRLAPEGKRLEAYDELVGEIKTSWSAKPRRIATSLSDLLAEEPSIGLLSLVDLRSASAYTEALALVWRCLHSYADVIVQGEPDLVESAMVAHSETFPEVRITVRRFFYVTADGARRVQSIAVFQKEPHDYPSLSRGQPRYQRRSE
ncbi:MAG: hypothetical protein B7733_11390 [Myxococcales bacterium FL481]|nr:MAG: hypothetical protein B7733_11390 [Myxococcales bacterium FL481]